MSARTPRRWLMVQVYFLAVLIGATLGAAKDLKIVGTQTLCFDDERTIERYLVRDLETGEVFARKGEEILGLVKETFSAQAKASSGGLTPWVTRRLPLELETLDFHLNSFADEHRDYFNEITNRLINPLRPVKKKKPKLRIMAEVIDPDHHEGAMLREFMDDGVNMIYTHPEDLGLPEDWVGASFGLAMSYWDYETLTYRGGDVIFSGNSFQESNYDRVVRRLIHEFGHIFGYYHTGWIEDFMSYVSPRHRLEYFWDPTNFVWDTSWLKDKMVYGGRRQADGNYQASVEILPQPDSVIGMEYLKVKASEPYLGRHVMFLTTLKGYRDRPMRLTLYRGREVRPNKKIVSISGYHPEFDQPETAGLLENYNTSILYFDRQKDFKRLKRAVKRRGEPDNFYDVSYSHVLRVTAVIEGYRGPNDPEPVTQTRTVRFAYREPSEQW